MKWFSARENFCFGLHPILVGKHSNPTDVETFFFWGGGGLYQSLFSGKIIALRTLRLSGGN